MQRGEMSGSVVNVEEEKEGRERKARGTQLGGLKNRCRGQPRTAELNDLRCLCLEEDEQIWRKLQEDVGGCPTAGHVGPPGPHDNRRRRRSRIEA
jgi:hypothetical protein